MEEGSDTDCKKGRGDVAKNYRGITIMTTLYKIYAAVLRRD